MAIYGFGSEIEEDDVSTDFIKQKIVGIAWSKNDAPDSHQLVRSLKVGDIIFLKKASYNSPIQVKAVGIITDDTILDSTSCPIIQIGRNVKWINSSSFTITKPSNEKNNVRSNSVYEEFHPEVQKQLLNMFPGIP
ncbi:hypothetical protein FACS189468_7080 [Spirochaetia bacterium]|nr:hypothetical protein FACS189468_7080 [Spirochaetia bacterium]